jgi:hypothetical protein
MEAMRAQFAREAEVPGAWTSYNPSLGRPLLNTKKFLEGKAQLDRDPEEHSDAAAAAAAGADSMEPFVPVSAGDGSNGTARQVTTDVQMELGVSGETSSDHPTSSLEALQQKFAAHKVTPVERKPN